MSPHPVDVWTIDLAAPRRAFLTSDEEARAARFRFEADRLHWICARSALREILALHLGVQPLEVLFTQGRHGKPATPGVEFNLSHARNRAMIAISHEVPVGIDVESIRPNVEMGDLLRRIGETELSGSIEQLFHVWTRREARIKALGCSLMHVPPPHVAAVDIRAPEGFAASVALVNRIPVVRYREE